MPVIWYNFIWGLVWIEMSVACWDRLMWQSELFRGQKCTFRTGRPWGILREAVYQTRKQYTAEDYFFKSLYGHICIVFNSFLLFSSSIKHEESMTLAQKHFFISYQYYNNWNSPFDEGFTSSTAKCHLHK